MTRSDLGLRISSTLGLALLPILVLQGRRVRRSVPRLPEAAGPAEGEVPGTAPPLHLLVVGESTVAGVGAATHRDALAGQVAQALASTTGRAVRWRALGRNGATAHTARTRLLEPARDLRADIAVVALGVNDTVRLHGRQRWTRDLALLVHALHARCGEIPVILAAVPPMGRFPALPRPLRSVLGLRARMLDRAAAQMADELKHTTHAPIPPRFDVVGEDFFCEDRFHPSVQGYRLWGSALGQLAAELCARE